jgi:predicted NAD/FAD-binding protein
MKIAVIGSGIAGLTSALIAQKNGHEVFLFEKNDYFGGHSNTIDFKQGDSSFPVDTGFLVHNRKTYPNLIKMFEYLEIPTVECDMTLSIKHTTDSLEWGGENLQTVFSQKKNLFKPSFYFFLMDILKFNRSAESYLELSLKNREMTLGNLLDKFNYSQELKKWYLIPMAAAIWSTPADKILDFPAWTFLQFCLNHHLLQVNGRPKWRSISGGAKVYVKKITDQIQHKYLNAKIQKINRTETSFEVFMNDEVHKFDMGILAAHPEQSLSLLSSPTREEKDLLTLFKYQPNKAFVHQDQTVLPQSKSIWSAWNYLSSEKNKNLCVTYLINKLQPLPTTEPVLVTLNPNEDLLDKNKLKKVIDYEHPLFDFKTVEAQSEISKIQGKQSTFYVGAWQGYGFHEDGAKSAIEVAKKLNWKIPWD